MVPTNEPMETYEVCGKSGSVLEARVSTQSKVKTHKRPIELTSKDHDEHMESSSKEKVDTNIEAMKFTLRGLYKPIRPTAQKNISPNIFLNVKASRKRQN